jgi:DNA mismatch repair protein MutS2
MIEKAKAEIDYIISQLSNGDLKLHEVIELKNKLEELEESEETEEFNEVISKGDYISVPSLGIYGKVVRIKGSKAKIQSDAGMSFDIETNKLHKEDKPVERHVKPAKNRVYEDIINTSISLELNIIGLRVEEAMAKLTKYIDNCRLKRLKQVRIIHGFGSGALRNATRKYLDTQKDLKYRAGGEHEGGGGATVVIFND